VAGALRFCTRETVDRQKHPAHVPGKSWPQHDWQLNPARQAPVSSLEAGDINPTLDSPVHEPSHDRCGSWG
jgi:hypothetical protein